MRYTVDETTFAINIYADGEDVPFLFQPNYPNGDTFDSVEEATAWAEASIAAHSAEVKVNAPNGKGLAGEPKIDLQAIAQARAELLTKLGITEDEARLLIPPQ
jgi:hypothetical protein